MVSATVEVLCEVQEEREHAVKQGNTLRILEELTNYLKKLNTVKSNTNARQWIKSLSTKSGVKFCDSSNFFFLYKWRETPKWYADKYIKYTIS
jgi:hypothetical protein